jgi:hypothetical protein
MLWLLRAELGTRVVPCLIGLTENIFRRALRSGDVTLIDRG